MKQMEKRKKKRMIKTYRNKALKRGLIFKAGGETGIRTLGTIAGTTVFETVPFNHSGISPALKLFIGDKLLFGFDDLFKKRFESRIVCRRNDLTLVGKPAGNYQFIW